MAKYSIKFKYKTWGNDLSPMIQKTAVLDMDLKEATAVENLYLVDWPKIINQINPNYLEVQLIEILGVDN